MTSKALPTNVRNQESLLIQLAAAYKQINAPVGQLGSDSLRYSTAGIASGTDADDSKYQAVEATLAQITSQRDTLANQIAAELNAAAFNGQTVDTAAAQAQIASTNQLLQQMHDLATNSGS